MRQALNLSALALFLALGAQSAGAQNLQLDQFTTALSSVPNQASLTINPSTGNVAITTAQGNYNACTFPVQSGSVSFTSIPTSAQVSTQISISWATVNPVGTNPCTPTQGGTTDWVSQGAAPGTSTRTVTLPATAGSVTFGMQCNTQVGLQSAQATVTVTAAGGGGGCTGGSPPDVMPTVSFPATWGDVFSNQPFPNPIGNARKITVPLNQSIALRFNPSGSITQGSIETAESPGDPGAPIRVSISKCAGEFKDYLADGRLCLFRGNNNQANLIFFNSSVSNPDWCSLETGSQYYVNLTHRVPRFPTNTSLPAIVTESDCPAAQCFTLLTARTLSPAEAEALGMPYQAPIFDGN